MAVSLRKNIKFSRLQLYFLILPTFKQKYFQFYVKHNIVALAIWTNDNFIFTLATKIMLRNLSKMVGSILKDIPQSEEQ